MKVEFEGTTYELPDGTSDEESLQLIEQSQPRKLFSLEGVSSTLRLVGPTIARGVLGSELAGMEEVSLARQKRGTLLTPEELSDEEEIKIRRQAIKEADLEIERIRGFSTKPLEIAQSAVQSVAQNLPGVTAAVATRQAGPIAAAPALLEAERAASGQAYADARIGKEAEIEPALKHSRVSGAVEAGFELLPTAWLIKNLGKMGAVEFVTKYIARELATELPTTATQKISERIFVEPEKPLGEFMSELGQELIDTALVVPFSAGMTGMAAKLTSKAGELGKPAVITDNPPQAETPHQRQLALIPPELIPPEVPIPTVPPTTESVEQADAIFYSIDPNSITPEQAAQAREELKKIDEMADAPAQEKVAVAWATLAEAPTDKVDASELGASAKQAANAVNYVNPNQGGRLDRVFSFSTDPEAIGKSPRQLLPQKGTYVLGQPTEDRPEFYLKALHESFEEWRAKFLPNATIVLSNEQLFTDSALGWHYSSTPGFHTIVPAVLRSPKEGLGKFNANAQASAFFNATHEFGHALIEDRLFEGVDPLVAKTAWMEGLLGVVSEQTIAQLPEAPRAIVEEFNEKKQRIMNETMTAQQFLDEWVGPAKAGRKTFLSDLGVAPTDSAMAVGKAMARRGKENSNLTKEDKKTGLQKQLLQDFFSLQEYLAEQTARSAYQKQWAVKTPLGKLFFEKLQSLKKVLAEFFTHLKKTGGIRAGTAFQEWLDDLGRADRPLTKKAKVAKGREKGVVKKAKAVEPKSKIKPKVKRAAHNVQSDTTAARAEQAKKLVANLVRNKDIEASDPDFKQMLKHIRAQEWEEFMDIFQKYSVKRLKFELDAIESSEERNELERMHAGYGTLRNNLTEKQALEPSVLADAAREWKEKGFRSKYFKAFFGDWENEAHAASQVVKPISGEPQILYHWTQGGQETGRQERLSFPIFSKGDIGFHFGTVRAAHVRGSFNSTKGMELEELQRIHQEEERPNAYIIPAVLNLRNPLELGSENAAMWGYPPHNFAAYLAAGGSISDFERGAVWLEIERLQEDLQNQGIAREDLILHQYDLSEPIRRLLMRKGYDGLVYENVVEGGRTYVAFYPEQVKSVLGHGTFSRSKQMHLELDFDTSTPEGEGGGKMLNTLRNFMEDPGPLKRALRRVADFSHSILQIQQLSHLNPDLGNLVSFNKFNTDYNLRKSKLQAPADFNTQRWSRLGKENQSKLSKTFLDEMEGGKNWFNLIETTRDIKGRQRPWYQFEMSARAVDELQKRGIDISTPEGEELGMLILDVKNDLLNRLNEKELVLWSLMGQRYAGNQQALNRAALALREHVTELRKFPFFPQGRFGNHMLIIEAKKEDGPGWDVVYKEAFASKTERDAAWKIADSKKNANQRVQAKELSDTTYVLMALPTDFLEIAATELDLSSEQLEHLQDVLQPVKTEKALKVYEQARLGVKGYTSDAIRSYANFAWHDSNMVAKMEYRSKLNLAITGMRTQLRDSALASPPSPQEFWRLHQVVSTMEKARDYIMSPPNELQSLRATISVAYLGLNIKTAALNLYGLVTTWSAVTSEMGLVAGTGHMSKAMLDAAKTLKLSNFNERRTGEYLEPDTQQALDRALEEGVLSQSYAYHLAGLANQGNLNRLIPGQKLGSRVTKAAIDLAMWPFRLTELSARRATFIAMFELAKSKQREGSLESLYDEAVRKTNLLQNDYSLGNRVPFMRGGAFNLGPVAPLATIFMSFAQHMAFHSYGGYELGQRRALALRGETPRSIVAGYTMKIWIVTLLLAGYEGLPGMENFIDLLEGLWRKFGGKKPVRQEIREFIQALDLPMIDPQNAAHGLGHNFFGFDISRSVGFGRFLPGTEIFSHPRDRTEELVGTLTLDMLGAAGSFVKFGMDTAFNNKPISENAKRMPGALGNIYTAYKWSEEGVRGPNDGLITHDLATGKIRDLTAYEIAGKVLGFNPTIVSQNREILFQQYDRKIYWQSRRSRLLDDAWEAEWQKDREARADVRKSVEEFNASIPSDYADLKIRGIDLARSRQAKRRGQRTEEAQTSPQRRYRSLYRGVKDSFVAE